MRKSKRIKRLEEIVNDLGIPVYGAKSDEAEYITPRKAIELILEHFGLELSAETVIRKKGED